ncbi:hypothetical protein [Lacrimispora indolis]|uniref:hypothetical protein n=1 Tax=Lacrimispora indolis TaxID=69825 RepID=UPI000462E21A|nr:hypothetical protein [[Clostridium] methoxybenzovorans]
MTDKERILLVIISRVIPGLMMKISDKDEYVKGYMLGRGELKPGDLVLANTTIYPNEFMVSYVDHFDEEKDCVVVREIGSDKLCNYFNESFTIINKERLGYEILEGKQYKTYQRVLKAFGDYTEYYTRFKSIEFEGDNCTVKARKAFENDEILSITFDHLKVKTIKGIGALLEKQEKRSKRK